MLDQGRRLLPCVAVAALSMTLAVLFGWYSHIQELTAFQSSLLTIARVITVAYLLVLLGTILLHKLNWETEYTFPVVMAIGGGFWGGALIFLSIAWIDAVFGQILAMCFGVAIPIILVREGFGRLTSPKRKCRE